MNLICTLPNVYVLPALISKFPLQVNVSIAVKMKLSLEETTHQICFVNGYYLKNIMELRFYIIISKAMHRRST